MSPTGFLRLAAHIQLMPVLESGEETLVGGQPLSEMIEGQARFPISVRLPETLRNDPEVLKEIDGITQAASDGVTAVERLLAKKQVEYRLMFQHGLFPVTIGHGQLVKVS